MKLPDRCSFFAQFSRKFITTSCLSLTLVSFTSNKHSLADAHLHIRRIIDYWKEGDYKTAKSHILDFFNIYPQTEFTDELLTMLGDLYFQESAYDLAIDAYQKIKEPKYREKSFVNLMQSYFELNNYQPVIEMGQDYLKQAKNNDLNIEKVRFMFSQSASKQAGITSDSLEQKSLAELARPHHLMLLNSRYHDFSLAQLAETYRLLGEYEAAAERYKELAEALPERKAELLMRVADLQTHFNRDLAIDTFAKIFPLGGDKAQQAAYNQMLLLYQNKEFKRLIGKRDEIAKYLNAKDSEIFDYLIGQSYFQIDEYQNAITPLLNFAMNSSSLTPEVKNALLCLALCSEKTSDVDTLERILNQMRTLFPKDEEFAQSLILHAKLCHQSSDLSSAQKSLEELLEKFPDHPNQDNILFDYALLLAKKEAYDEGRSAFAHYLNTYPDSAKSHLAWKYLLNCSIQDLQKAEENNIEEKKKQCISDMAAVLEQKEVLTDQERARYQFLLSKNLYETENYAEAIAQLKYYISNYSEHEHIADAYLLLGMAKLDSKKDWKGFVNDAEKALTLNPELKENHLVHLHLFNAYIQLKEDNDGKDEQYDENAAQHLLSSFYTKSAQIKPSNLLWLANYYYDQFQTFRIANSELFVKPSTTTMPYIEQALDIYSSLFSSDAEGLMITADTSYLEEEVLKFTELLEYKGQFEKKLRCLSALVATEKGLPEADWKFQRHVLFELGKTHEKLGNINEAIEAYDFLVESSSHISSYHAYAACLHKSCLRLKQIPAGEFNENNLQVLSTLNSFKDLQIKRKLHSEPIHLEAAIEYVELKAKLTAVDDRLKRTIVLYQCLQSDFLAENDPISADYNAAKNYFPEKDATLNEYMTFIDMQIAFLEEKRATENNQTDLIAKFNKIACSKLAELQSKEAHLSPYLLTRLHRVVKDQTNDTD